jgi:hypothetical protein
MKNANEKMLIERNVFTPLKGLTQYGWHFEQNVVDPIGKCYALKSSEGSGNKIKVIIYEKICDLRSMETGRRVHVEIRTRTRQVRVPDDKA